MKWRIRKKKPKRAIVLRPHGKLYNLEEIYREINETYFEGKIAAHISWFGSGLRTPKSSMTFGSYHHQLNLIKVNRLLDDESYPEYFVRYIVFHEMLHQHLPPKRGKRGKRDIHHREFKEKEELHPDFERAKSFLKQWRKKHFASGNGRKNEPPVV